MPNNEVKAKRTDVPLHPGVSSILYDVGSVGFSPFSSVLEQTAGTETRLKNFEVENKILTLKKQNKINLIKIIICVID